MPKKIFILNSPPRCGKDTIASECSRLGCYQASFKEPLYRIVSSTLNMSLDRFMDFYNMDDWKDKKFKHLGGKSVRDLMIHTSENYVKPFFGKDYFGKELANYIIEVAEDDEIVVIPDGGFKEEVLALTDAFGFDKVEILQISREGYRDFGNDSRNWINIDEVKTVKFDTTSGNDEVIQYIMKEKT